MQYQRGWKYHQNAKTVQNQTIAKIVIWALIFAAYFLVVSKVIGKMELF